MGLWMDISILISKMRVMEKYAFECASEIISVG
jgi:hypothetical protein